MSKGKCPIDPDVAEAVQGGMKILDDHRAKRPPTAAEDAHAAALADIGGENEVFFLSEDALIEPGNAKVTVGPGGHHTVNDGGFENEK